MGFWSKIRAWWAPVSEPTEPDSPEVVEESVEEEAIELPTRVEEVLSEEAQQLKQIKELLASPDLNNHELAAMFLLGLNYGWDEEMYQLVIGQADKLTFWISREDNEPFLQRIRTLRIGPRFFGQYSEIAEFAATLPQLIYLEELYWEAKHYWNQHPILVAASSLPRLQILHFCDCKMNYLPDAIVEATQLQALHLSGNKLTELPDRLELLSELRILDLSANTFNNCPRPISGLRRLEVLRLQENPMKDIEPRLLGRLYRLRDLQLPEVIAKFNLEALKDWLPDVDFEQSYWKFDE
ncbi:MAG: leucine-rich repeat domain-containing protein [Aureispira sp.]